MNICLRFTLALLIAIVLISSGGCSNTPETKDAPRKEGFKAKSLAKSDIDAVLDAHIREIRNYLRELMIKLYKRNPRELAKSRHHKIEKNVARVFDEQHNWNFAEMKNVKGVDAIYLAFDQAYAGDRVFALIVGMTSMIMASYNNKAEFYMLDSVEPQKLYNSARNIEIVAWKLTHDVDIKGKPLLYSNSLPGEVTNLSYERLLGKMIATQDNIAIVVADSTNRIIKKVIQQMATAVFLPI